MSKYATTVSQTLHVLRVFVSSGGGGRLKGTQSQIIFCEFTWKLKINIAIPDLFLGFIRQNSNRGCEVVHWVNFMVTVRSIVERDNGKHIFDQCAHC